MWGYGTNLLTFEGFPKAVKLKSGQGFFYMNENVQIYLPLIWILLNVQI